MKSADIRKLFLEFFQEKGHLVMPSSSLIPDDPTLLLTAAGMVQFKPYFLNLAQPPHKRITTVQKCVRTSDIERVGETARHLTFFEMLGNFSFGDYYKREAIGFAVEFLFERLGLDRSKFWITVYEDDDEAFEIWSKEFGFPEERIVRLGKEDNFWEAGPVGPCGPCSELIVDRGEEYGCGRDDCKPGCDCDRFLEIWNLVFMQFNKNEDGSLTPLPKKNIDTGMGLERISLLLQNAKTVFETDLLYPIVQKAASLTGIEYGREAQKDRSLKIIADHIKASTFLLGDGVIPSNEGRGYILRRLIRRSLSHARKLGHDGAISKPIADKVIELFGDVYPELKDNRNFILNILETEEKRFLNVLERGLALIEDEFKKLKKSSSRVLSGKTAFKLYDTYGFPVELTVELSSDEGFEVDVEEFNRLLEESRRLARESWKGRKFVFDASIYSKIVEEKGETEFTGYLKDEDEADIIAILKENELVHEASYGEEVQILLTQTPFYPEGGGQVGDVGRITGVTSDFEFEVIDTQQPVKGAIVHIGKVVKGKARVGDRVKCSIDRIRRRNTEKNHTATHLLHWALRLVLGEGVKQSGSFVSPDYFRFDFPFERALTEEELRKIERLVNQKIAESHPVRKFETTIDTARQLGAIALFGEKYGDFVRVVEVGDFSRELCGGTHVNNSSEISFFIIKSEHSIGSGLRRIEAITGAKAIEYALNSLNTVRSLARILQTKEESVFERITSLIEEHERIKLKLEKEKEERFQKELLAEVQSAPTVSGVKIVKNIYNNYPLKELKSIIDLVRKNYDDYAVIVGSAFDEKASFFVAISNSLAKKGLDASKVAKQAARIINGGGGGTSTVADAGGKDVSKLKDALDFAEKLILEKLG